jgi:hypothetical protein
VNGVLGVNLFRRENGDWRLLVAPRIVEIAITKWQLPELLAVVVVADSLPPDRVTGMPPLGSSGGVGGGSTAGGGGGAVGDGGFGVAVPVVPEVC